MITKRQRRIVRTVSDFVISNESGGASVKRPSEANIHEGLPRKRIVVSRKEENGDVLMAEVGVQHLQEPLSSLLELLGA